MGWKVYLVKCADNSLYCGITNDITSRIAKHNAGKGSKYTQSRLPVELMAVSGELSKSDALTLEHYIKQQPAGEKIDGVKTKHIGRYVRGTTHTNIKLGPVFGDRQPPKAVSSNHINPDFKNILYFSSSHSCYSRLHR